MPLRLIFMGTPEFSVSILQALHAAGHKIVAVYSQPPRPAGRRGLEITKSPVHQAAEKLGLPVLTPSSLKGEEEQKTFRDFGADAAVVVAYGLLLPKPILEGTTYGAFNGHASLLPRWRGAAPIQRAIMAGDSETGMMIMKMDEGLDTGPVALTRIVPIGPDTTARKLHDALMETGASLMVEAMAALKDGLTLIPQSEDGVTYARKISKEETRIDWSCDAKVVHNHIRGLSLIPGAWCEMELGGKPERVKILRSARVDDASGAPGEVLDDVLTVACGSGAVRLLELQRAGGKVVTAADFLRGAAIGKGQRVT